MGEGGKRLSIRLDKLTSHHIYRELTTAAAIGGARRVGDRGRLLTVLTKALAEGVEVAPKVFQPHLEGLLQLMMQVRGAWLCWLEFVGG